MSKMGNSFFEMQEDAIEMSKEEFVKKYGKLNEDIYDQIRSGRDPEPEFLSE
jgi:hypothetical protein